MRTRNDTPSGSQGDPFIQQYAGLLAGMSLNAIDTELAEKSLREYVELAWPILEPANPFKPGWHIDAICEHLQAVTDGEIKRLIINMPPRHMKSLGICVFWPTWEWGPRNNPESRWLYSSYADTLSIRDSRKSRIIIQSPWYQEQWGERFKLVGDQNEKKRFENDKMGYRIATTIRGVGTGEGGDRIVVDDPHNVIEGESKKKRAEVVNWWDESMSSRGNNPDTVAFVIIQQRVNEGDLTGHQLEKDAGYEHLCLPARYEGENRIFTSIGKPDPRTELDEPLWPEQYDDAKLSGLEKDLGSQYAVAGQLQQRPSPREGGKFNINDFVIISPDAFRRDEIKQSIRYWDKAGTREGDGAYTAGLLGHRCLHEEYDDEGELIDREEYFVWEDVERGRWEAPEREKTISRNAQVDGRKVVIWVEQEPGSGGKESAQNTQRRNPGFTVKKDPVTGSKETRAEPYETAVEAGTVRLVRGPWVKAFLDEHKDWPNGKWKDQVDAGSGCYGKLTGDGGTIYVA